MAPSRRVVFRGQARDFMALPSHALGGRADVLHGVVLRMISSAAFRAGNWDYPPPLVDTGRAVRVWAKTLDQIICVDAIQVSDNHGLTWDAPVGHT